ncbi:MAG: amidase [Gammaproteobacteria bacterium]|nr:amidase [Gammaproteobacteria bacterium]
MPIWFDQAGLAAHNEQLNAFTAFDRDAAPADGVLSGVAVGVKANIMVRGLPWHAGLGAWRDRIAPRDAAIVARLREQGAAIIGTCNMDEAGLGAKGDNPWFGAVQNPHRAGWSAGGSSCGGAAAVAAGLCDVALGTDSMGSARIPASHCGVYAFKAAPERISADGIQPVDPSLDAASVIARDISLLVRAGRVVSAFGEAECRDAGAMLSAHGFALHPKVKAAFDRAIEKLPERPAAVRLDHPNDRIRLACFVHLVRALGPRLAAVPTSPRLARLIEFGANRAPSDWHDDQVVLADTRRQLASIIACHGFIVMPTVGMPTFPLAEPEPASQADFTCLANIARLPVLTLPMGWTDDGLPLGIQLVVASGCECKLFRISERLDADLQAFRSPRSL